MEDFFVSLDENTIFFFAFMKKCVINMLVLLSFYNFNWKAISFWLLLNRKPKIFQNNIWFKVQYDNFVSNSLLQHTRICYINIYSSGPKHLTVDNMLEFVNHIQNYEIRNKLLSKRFLIDLNFVLCVFKVGDLIKRKDIVQFK